ncbi:ABC transporter ATP-binding protein [Dethiosulfatarculus sandiegensis]|uniref:ABC transporter ATP-binding protein n=1 Tax=Dethiosulfatarculus sandiegensis TaxID=1429043 RepID=UPI0005C90C2F|nr:ABC transporter ATP-binding protein [Dethiosulfatarculus sandiegensis]
MNHTGAPNSEYLLALEGLVKHFQVGTGFMAAQKQVVHAVDQVNLAVRQGEVMGLVGESGCGKSTLGQLALGLLKPDKGRILFQGREITGLSRKKMRDLRREMQIVFQDPVTSLNPRMTVESILSEPFKIHGLGSKRERAQKVARLMEDVGLRADQARRYPHQFSGGQRQRIGIARALALRPKLVVADEPVSALDVSIQAQVMNLLASLKKRFGLTYLFIAHDLSVVRHLSDRIAVMYLGKIVEISSAKGFGEGPIHPYTNALIQAAPVADPHIKQPPPPLIGDVASPINPPSGCRFHTRCPKAMDICSKEEPGLKEKEPGHFMACHLYA